MTASMPAPRSGPKPLRCAIYTRKSTEQGLEQAFNSLDNQREAAEAYVKSQAHEGWRLQPAVYDDGGFSGGSLERPALQRLLDEIRAGRVDIIVVYKVDRLTRSLADFAKLVDLFDRHGTSFVSVTQAFNTTTSMGRLTLNVLLSFAQFEREVTGERIRDKIAASKRKGFRVGGPVALGYQAVDKKLVPCPVEAEQVRLIFRRYLDLGSLGALLRDLDDRGLKTKAQRRPDGTARGGIGFNKSGLSHLLKNRCYIGEVIHKGQHFPGAHEPIVPNELFRAVGSALAAKSPWQRHPNANRTSLLKGLALRRARLSHDPDLLQEPGTALSLLSVDLRGGGTSRQGSDTLPGLGTGHRGRGRPGARAGRRAGRLAPGGGPRPRAADHRV